MHKKTSYCYSYLREVWQETFPNEKEKAKTKIDERKERARIAKEYQEKMKDMTQEEIDAYMEKIPEWKRGALVVSNAEEKEEQETKGLFGRTKDRFKDRIN